jgi:hypothetical protein
MQFNTNTLFSVVFILFVATVMLGLAAFNYGINLAAIELAQINNELATMRGQEAKLVANPDSIDTLGWIRPFFRSLVGLAVLGSLYFMWAARHPKAT